MHTNDPRAAVYRAQCHTFTIARRLSGLHTDGGLATYLTVGQPIDTFRALRPYRTPAALALRSRVAVVVRAERNPQWRPASGHPGGWRCWRDTPGDTVSGRQLESTNGRVILFRTMAGAAKRCALLNGARAAA